ncbi:copper amine oxidase N-terminal domain-containing protein [Paenibacillus contaminans]|uniref:Copper amine oxidase-like N-terminal domain-containing protein n=1 Tax=Paenibacillus contaminans TaxID=450362 RepID=A0A329LS76_9BACL|nr:copper amine oxidase N-terminal domain-containing protein [Paenibacillus contaminans]RAV10795.1 hypothetical protein DQG23_37235 [Paenibacillus contaminans]
MSEMKKKKSFLVSVALLTLLASVTVANGEDRMTDTFSVDGKAITYEYGQPFVQMNVDLVPVRDLLIALGVPNDDAHIVWNGEEQSVTAISGKLTLKMALDQADLYKNGSKAAKFATAPKMVDGRVYISVKEVAEALGYKVERDKNGRIISVGSADYIRSQSPSDKVAPYLISAVALTGSVIEVEFNEKIDKVSAETAANYSIQSSQESLTISKAELKDDQTTVKLTVPRQSTGAAYKVSVEGVKDTSGNVNDRTTVTFVGITTLAEREHSPNLALLSVVSNGPNTVIATFNQDLDRISAEQPQNYSLNMTNKKLMLNIFKAELMDNNRAVMLTTSSQPVDGDYKLVVTNVRSSAKGSAIETADNSYQFSLTPQDTLGLRPLSAIAVSNSIVQIQFSESLDPKSAETAANYRIALESGHGEETLTVAGAELIEGGKKVRLTVSWGMEEGAVYKVTLNNIKNANGILIDRDNQYSRFFGVSPQ